MTNKHGYVFGEASLRVGPWRETLTVNRFFRYFSVLQQAVFVNWPSCFYCGNDWQENYKNTVFSVYSLYNTGIKRIMDVSYPGWTFRTQRFGRFVPKSLDVSYPSAGRFVPWLVVSYPSVFFISLTWFGRFIPKHLSLIQPNKVWSFRPWVGTQIYFVIELVSYCYM